MWKALNSAAGRTSTTTRSGSPAIRRSASSSGSMWSRACSTLAIRAFSSTAAAAAAPRTSRQPPSRRGSARTSRPPAATSARLNAFRKGDPRYGARPVRAFSAHSASQKAATATSVNARMNALRDMPSVS